MGEEEAEYNARHATLTHVYYHLYRFCYPTEYKKPNTDHIVRMLESHRKQYLTNAKLHVRTNLWPRTERWLMYRYKLENKVDDKERRGVFRQAVREALRKILCGSVSAPRDKSLSSKAQAWIQEITREVLVLFTKIGISNMRAGNVKKNW